MSKLLSSSEELETNPWTTLESKIVYKNPWITVKEDQVLRPDGKPGIYSVVETRIATAAIALTTESEVYLVGQYRYATSHYSWEVIEGGTDPGEDPIEAAKRELAEEAGIVGQNWKQLGGEIHLTNCHSSEVGYVFLATELSEVPRTPDGTEVLQVRKIPLEDCLALVHDGTIKDTLSIVSLLRLERELNLNKK